MKYTKKIVAVTTLLLMLLLVTGCNEQTPAKNADDSGVPVPNMTVEKEGRPEKDTEGSFTVEDFAGEKSNAVVLGGSRTEKIQELEEAEIQRETVPDGSVEWIPGVW